MLYEKIKKLCEEKGIAIYQLEKECGFGNATITKWRESMPKADNLKKVADYFNVSIEYFIDGEG